LKEKKLPLEVLSSRQLLELQACTRCGECLNWCPVYAKDSREEITPRAKLLRLKSAVKEEYSVFTKLFSKGKTKFPIDQQLMQIITQCSVCGQCHYVCPVRIDTVELWEAVREMLVAGGVHLPKGQWEMAKAIKESDNPWNHPNDLRYAWMNKALTENLIEKRPKNILKEEASVLYFVGCTAAYDEKINATAQQTINLLQAAEVDFGVLGENEPCCRGKLRRVGDPAWREYALENIEMLNSLNIDTVVISCPGCYKTIKQDYTKLKQLNFKIYHLTEYVQQLYDQGKIKFTQPMDLSVTYHDPCHLGRHNRIYDAPRDVIKALPGIQLIEMERIRQNSRCCGVGGGLKMAFPELQTEMSVERIHDAEKTGAEAVVTPCPSCYSGLKKGIDASDSTIKLYHFTELVTAALDVRPERDAGVIGGVG